MHNAAGGRVWAQSDDCNDRYRTIVSDLVSLIKHVQASMKLVETAIARESPLGNREVDADIVLLDDVTPRYIEANVALAASNAGLGAALHFLLDATTSKHEPTGVAGNGHRRLA